MRKKSVFTIFASMVLLSTAHADLTNIALNDGVTVTAQRQEGTNSAANTIDGNYSTQWGSGSSSTAWLIVDLAGVYTVDSINIVGVYTANPSWFNYTVNYNLYTSLNQVDWTYIGAGILYDNADWNRRSELHNLNNAQVHYVKFQSTGGQHWPGFNEMEIFQTTPEPTTLALLALGAIGLLKRKRG